MAQVNRWAWSEMTKRGHAGQHLVDWEYQRTWVFERDHPDGWTGRDAPPAGDGWEKNDQIGDKTTPGFEVRDGASGRMLLSYWRRPTP